MADEHSIMCNKSYTHMESALHDDNDSDPTISRVEGSHPVE